MSTGPRREPRDKKPTEDLRRQFSNDRYGRIGSQARGAIALAWYRGEQEGFDRAIRWLARNGHKKASIALRLHLGGK